MTPESKPMSEVERLANDYQATCFSVSGGESPYHVDAFIAGYEACAKSKDAQIAELVSALRDAYKRIDDKARHHYLEGDDEMYKIMNIVSVLAKHRSNNE